MQKAKKKVRVRNEPPVSICVEPAQALNPLSVYQVLEPDGFEVGAVPDISNERLHRMYRFMRLIRQLDERMMILQRQGRVGFYGACTGQEASPIGAAAALRPSDWIFPGLREGVAMLYRGHPLESYVCQVFGNSGDLLKGRQMPSHYADRKVAFVSWSSCIGPQITQAVGAAWAAKLTRSDDITVAFMGDGATSSADFHTGLNFAGVYKVPCVLICQNNHWSISVPSRRQTASRTIAEKAVAYGLPFARVDGNDVLAVYAAVEECAERARSGGGPSFLEMVTYRIGAHSSSDDPRVYRDEAEVDEWKNRDPLVRFRAWLLATDRLTESEDEALRAEIEQTIQETVSVAERRKPPSSETLFTDVYAQMPWNLVEQAEAHRRGDGSDSK